MTCRLNRNGGSHHDENIFTARDEATVTTRTNWKSALSLGPTSYARCKLHGREAVRRGAYRFPILTHFLSNAAKARTRDTTTRTQKGFFERKRLEILGQQ